MGTPYDVVTEVSLHSVSPAERDGVLKALATHLPQANVTTDAERTDPVVVTVRLEMVEDDASTAQVRAVSSCQAALEAAGLSGRAAPITEARVEPPIEPRSDPQPPM